ncbi:MAG: hypothetical protein DRH08_00230 [Deltaproteobacteria bacterium]|nr:MAG: hypothetical protein DRH08_00230 [Deltaproteobacteria bacterium]
MHSSLEEMTQQPHYPLGWVLLQNTEPLVELGIRDPLAQRLGKGAFGTAYEVPMLGKSVIKLTRDPSEMQASTLLRGRKSKRIVQIYDLWAAKGSFGGDLRGWYIIHREYLTPLSKRDMFLIDAIFTVYGDMSLDLVIPRSLRQHAMIQKWRGYLREELINGDGIPSDDEGGTMSFGGSRFVKRAVQLLVQVGEAVNEMHKSGIDWEDIHSGNIMRNSDKKLVIADVGFGVLHNDFDTEVPFLTSTIAQQYVSDGHQ